MRVSDIDRRSVLDVSTATSVGQIDDVVVDPVRRTIVGFSLRKAPGNASWLAWDRMKAIGTDAVTVDSAEALAAAPEAGLPPALKHDRVIGELVLSDQGYALGELLDVEFDPDSGAVTELVLGGGRALPADALRGIGHYAVVVGHPDSAPG